MRRENKYQNKHWLKNLSVFKMNVIFSFLWIAVCVMYLAIINDITVKGYEMKKLENKVSELQGENKNLSLDLSDKQSMERVMAEMRKLGMVESGRVTYLTMPSTVVVKR